MLTEKPWRDHSVDLRVSVPIPYRPFYLTLIDDPEKRSTERRGLERMKHPLLKAGNVVFIIGSTLVLLGTVIVATLLFTSIVE